MPRADTIRNAFIVSESRQSRYSKGWLELIMILLLASILSFGFFTQAPPTAAPRPPAASQAAKAPAAAAAPKAAVMVKPGSPRVMAPRDAAAIKAAAAKAAMAPKPRAGKPGEPAVLTIGTERITKSQFEEIIGGLPEDVRGRLATPGAKREFAKQYAEMKSLAIEGEKKMTADPKVRSRWQVNLDQTMASLYMRDASEVNETTARQYYNEHKTEFENANGRHILIRFKGSPVPLKTDQKDLTEEEALAKVTDIRKRLAAGEDFAELAKKESDDTGSGAAGGALGDFPRGMMVPPFDQAAFALPIGQLSEPVKTQFGYHLIQIQSKKSSTFEEAKQMIERKQKPELTRKALEDVKARYPVVLDDAYFGAN